MGGIAWMAGKALVQQGLNKVKNNVNNAVDANAPLENLAEQPLSARPDTGLVSKIVHLVNKGSVIDAQMPQGGGKSDLAKLIEKRQSAPRQPLNEFAEHGENEQPEPQENRNEPPKVSVQPITIDDFKEMVGTKKGGLGKVNKGYVRFAKDENGNVKLEKVGNKCGIFINSRINVTPEHNRQMRQLFADTLLADWGGADNVAVNKNVYGAKIATALGNLRSMILNPDGKGAGGLLSRAEIKNALDEYAKIFSQENLSDVSETFLKLCLDGTEFTLPDKSLPTVDGFLGKYGTHAAEGYRSKAELENKIHACKTGAELRACLEKIADEFQKMNVYWQQDKRLADHLDSIAQSLTTGDNPFDNEEELAFYRSTLLKDIHLSDGKETKPEDVTRFLTKILPAYRDNARIAYNGETYKLRGKEKELEKELSQLRSQLKNRKAEVDRLTEGAEKTKAQEEIGKLEGSLTTGENRLKEVKDKLKQLTGELKAKFGYDAIKAEAEKFIEAFIAHGKENKGVSSSDRIKTMLEISKTKITDDLQRKLDENPDVSEEERQSWMDKADKAVAAVQEQLDFLADADKVFQEKLDAELKSTNDKFLLKSGEDGDKTRSWTKEGLEKVVSDGFEEVQGKDFDDEFFMMTYVHENFNRGTLPASCQKALDNVTGAFSKLLQDALDKNLVSADDISLSQFTGAMADYLLTSSVREDLQTNAWTLDVQGKRKGSVSIGVEHMMTIFVNKAIARKAEGDKYLDTGNEIAGKIKPLLKRISNAIQETNIDKLPQVKKFYEDLRAFSRKDAVGEDFLHQASAEMKEDVARAIKIKALEKFLDTELFNLLDEADDASFAKALDARLGLCLTEAICAESDQSVRNFYEGKLGFRTTSQADKDALRMEESLEHKDAPAEKHQYAHGDWVRQGFVDSIGKADVAKRIAEARSKSGFHVISNETLKGAMTRKAEALWRTAVVQKAPGRHYFNAVDWVVYKFKKTFNMDRFKDVDKAWVEGRQKDFAKDVDRMMEKYFSFESKFLAVCRQRVADALDATGDSRLANVHDPAQREQVTNDVLAKFSREIGAVLERFVASPEAFAGLLKDPVQFEKLANDTLGFGRAEGKDLEKTSGFQTVQKALDTTIKHRVEIVKSSTNDSARLASDLVDKILRLKTDDEKKFNALPKSQRDFLDNLVDEKNFGSFGQDLVKWLVNKQVENAVAHPLDVYCEKAEDFMAAMVDRALAEGAQRFAGFGEAMQTLRNDKHLGAIGLTVNGKTEIATGGVLGKLAAEYGPEQVKLHSILENEAQRATLQFVSLYADMDVAKLDGNKRQAALEKISSSIASHVETVMINAANRLNAQQDEAFEDALKVYNAALDEAEKGLRGRGVQPAAMMAFREEADKLFASGYEKLNKDIADGKIQEKDSGIQNATARMAADVRTLVEKLCVDFTNALVETHLDVSEAGFAKLIAARNESDRQNVVYADPKAVHTAYEAFLADQKAEVDIGQDSLLAILQYAVLDAVVKGTTITAGEVIPQPPVGKIRDAFNEAYAAAALKNAQESVKAQAMNLVDEAVLKNGLAEEEEKALRDEVAKKVGELLEKAKPTADDFETMTASADRTRGISLAPVSELVEASVAKVFIDRQCQDWLDLHLKETVEKVLSENPEFTPGAAQTSEAVNVFLAIARDAITRSVAAEMHAVLSRSDVGTWDALLTKNLTNQFSDSFQSMVSAYKGNIKNAENEVKAIAAAKKTVASFAEPLQKKVLTHVTDAVYTGYIGSKQQYAGLKSAGDKKGLDFTDPRVVVSTYVDMIQFVTKLGKLPNAEKAQNALNVFEDATRQLVQTKIDGWSGDVEKDNHHETKAIEEGLDKTAGALFDELAKSKGYTDALKVYSDICGYVRNNVHNAILGTGTSNNAIF